MTFVLNSSLQVHLPQVIKKISDIDPGDVPESIRDCLSKQNSKESHREMLQELLHLLSEEIKKYVDGAFAQDWPFLPPTINPTIMNEQNLQIPKLNQVELLLLCLNFALESEEYRMALSIAFVVDRFAYWRDGSSALLKIVDQIQKLAPSIPVSPQLVIRKARVMKDNGDLHGSIQILDSLTSQKWNLASLGNCPSNWQYKAEHQYINVCAVCVQIKGQIYHNLGLWKEAISPLMESIQGFQMLEVVDFKGISYSYSLLSRCLCRLSKREYSELRQEYSFQFDHHCYMAYKFGMMAYKDSPGQRLFLGKHLLQSGECLLMYTVQLTDGNLQYKMFLEIMNILNLVFYNQNPEEFSQSKDQLFIFIKALFVTCLTLGCSYNPIDRDMGNYLETICLFVYGKFCDIGANQLDSEIGVKNLQEIIPALNSALTRLSQQNVKIFSKSVTADVNHQHTLRENLEKDVKIDLNQLPERKKVQDALGVECTQTTQFNEIKSENKYDEHGIDKTGRKVPLPVISKTDGKKLQRLSKMAFENEVTMDTIVDCETDTQGSGLMSRENTSLVNCEVDVKKQQRGQRERISMVDCRADTQERVEITSVVDCEGETREKVEGPIGKIQTVDCEAETRVRVGGLLGKIRTVDCEAETKKRVESSSGNIPMVDCEAETKESVGSFGERISLVDCEKNTQERVEIPSGKIPMADFRVGDQGRECIGTSINVVHNSTSDSGFESFQSSLSREKQNSVLRPRIVGLPSHVSDIENKVLQLDKLHRNVDDFIQETYSLATGSIDASLVNTTALTAIRDSRKDGTHMRNRLLNKFQRQESLTEELPVNISTVDDIYQESLSSFIGKLLQEHLKPNMLSSETNFRLPVSNLNVDSASQNETVNKIQKATLYQYNPVTYVWSGQDTIVCTGKELTLGKGKKGSFRNVYQITFLHQDEPLGKYVSKRYRQQREPLQYMDDVVSQMQAALYVNHFNQELKAFESDLRIHFLTAAYMLLYDSDGKVEDWMNIEPFVDGEFLKLTNNYDFCEPRGKNVSTSFTHFTYVKSGGKLMVSDLQGWLPTGTQNLIYLTDPQFHTDSGDSSPFDFGQEGMKVFFDVVHPECNEICKTLELGRPDL